MGGHKIIYLVVYFEPTDNKTSLTECIVNCIVKLSLTYYYFYSNNYSIFKY